MQNITYVVESLHDTRLVVNHALPEARRLRCVRNSEVRLQAHFVALWKRRVDLSAVCVVHTEGDTGSLEEGLEEELGVERERHRVEGDCLMTGDERI